MELRHDQSDHSAFERGTACREGHFCYWISDDFEKEHIGEFIAWLKRNIDSFQPYSRPWDFPELPHAWPATEAPLLTFAFSPGKREFIQIGMQISHAGPGGQTTYCSTVDRAYFAPARLAFKQCFDKARKTFTEPISDGNCNVVLMQPAIHLHDEDVLDILYGTPHLAQSRSGALWEERANDGLFHTDTFSSIAALAYVPPGEVIFTDMFSGSLSPHPRHFQHTCRHKPPFLGMSLVRLPEWRGERLQFN